MMTRLALMLSIAAGLGLAMPLPAQGRAGAQSQGTRTLPDAAQSRAGTGVPGAQSRDHGARSRDAGIPPGHMPPPGMCRIWIDGVPPGRQPRATDCATARRNVPRNGRIIYGDDARYGDRNRDRRDCPAVWDWMCRDDDPRRDDDRRRRDDDDRRRDDYCLDRNRDGRCDRSGNIAWDPRNFPRTLPSMMGAVIMRNGIRSPEVVRWLGNERVVPRYTLAGRVRAPQRVVWVDQGGRVVQVWIDSNRDGRADRVELYRNGRRVDVIR